MKPSLLFISKGCPNGIKSAGDVRALRLLKILTEKYDITCWFTSADYGHNEIRALGIEPVQNGAENVFDIICSKRKPDKILVSHWLVAQRYIEYIRKRTNVPIIIDTIDVEFLRMQREQAYKDKAEVSTRRIEAIKNAELDIYRRADSIMCVTDIDKQEIQKHGRYRINVIPCLFEMVDNVVAHTKNVYTICNWSHAPNVDATIFLCQKVMPSLDDVTLFIVGKHPPREITRYASERIIICNAVFDLKTFLSDKAICLAPILWGSGMNGKIGEAMAYGIPVITTTMGAMPYKLEHRENAMIADGELDFVNYTVEVLCARALQLKLSAGGRELIKDYTVDAWKEKILEAI